VLIGSYRHGVDAKGRVAVPALLRRSLDSGSVIAQGQERRLVIYPPVEWAATEIRYRLTAETGREERAFIRQLYASARHVDLDAQGRLLLDAEHRRHAQIDDRAVFVGLCNVVEVVGEALWDAEQRDANPDAFSDLADRVNARPDPGVPTS